MNENPPRLGGFTAGDMHHVTGPFSSTSGICAAHSEEVAGPRITATFFAISWFVSCTTSCGFVASS